MFCSKYSSASGYLKHTFLNSTVPFSSLLFFVIFPSFILDCVSNTSLIRFADTCALGSIINIIASIKKDIITWRAYELNTTISPNKTILSAIAASFIKYAPTKYIPSVTICITIYITGCIIANALWLNNCCFVKLLFACSNLSSWYFSALNALTTLIPVKFSLVTPFNLSINFWTFLNLGSTITISTIITANNITTAAPVIALHCQLLFNIFVTAHIAVIGAFINNCNPIAINISICVTSFVVLVIKLLVENPFTSCIDKFSTFSNIFFLIFIENTEDIFDVIYPVIIAATKLPNAQASI